MKDVDDLVKYLFDCRIDYVGVCKLDDNTVISEMRGDSWLHYLEHRIAVRRNNGEVISCDLEKRALEIFREKERGVIVIV